MAPAFRGSNTSSGIMKKAAVMICIFPGKQDLEIVFFKRNDYDGPHGGQVSFPGGVYEEKDNDLAETAIRETHEEIGLNCGKSSLLGKLTPLLIPVSKMHVQPFIGFYNTKPVFTIEKREVEYLIISPIGVLLDPSCVKKEKWILHGLEVEVPFYTVNGNVIWGATAMILSEFLAIISHSGLYPQFRYSGNDRSDT
jgi:8-oxo-dGTP pyrophosphatase MutT (NUDIX family)